MDRSAEVTRMLLAVALALAPATAGAENGPARERGYSAWTSHETANRRFALPGGKTVLFNRSYSVMWTRTPAEGDRPQVVEKERVRSRLAPLRQKLRGYVHDISRAFGAATAARGREQRAEDMQLAGEHVVSDIDQADVDRAPELYITSKLNAAYTTLVGTGRRARTGITDVRLDGRLGRRVFDHTRGIQEIWTEIGRSNYKKESADNSAYGIPPLRQDVEYRIESYDRDGKLRDSRRETQEKVVHFHQPDENPPWGTLAEQPAAPAQR